jgi:hypothetical protein
MEAPCATGAGFNIALDLLSSDYLAGNAAQRQALTIIHNVVTGPSADLAATLYAQLSAGGTGL